MPRVSRDATMEPCKALVAGILRQALTDASSTSEYASEAREFFASDDCRLLVELVGLDIEAFAWELAKVSRPGECVAR